MKRLILLAFLSVAATCFAKSLDSRFVFSNADASQVQSDEPKVRITYARDTDWDLPTSPYLFIKLNRITFYPTSDSSGCTGNPRTLDLSSNSWWDSGIKLDGASGTVAGSISFYLASLEAAREQLNAASGDFPSINGMCADIDIQYRTSASPYFGQRIFISQDLNLQIENINGPSSGTIPPNTPINTAQTIEKRAHVIMNRTSNAFQCWGNNASGQVGANSSDPVFTLPQPVSGLMNGVVKTVGGGSHSCALTDTGKVYCWGGNALGQLGLGSSDPAGVKAPVVLTSLANVRDIAAGENHTCALLNDGTVDCWGDDDHGQLGLLLTFPCQVRSDREVPQYCVISPTMTVPAETGDSASQNFISITAAGNHTCGMTSSGVVSCWGQNDSGQLGDGTNRTSLLPVAATGITNALQVSAGTDYTCALTRNYQVKCWGKNDNGQLGNGTTAPSNVPVTVLDEATGAPLEEVSQISAGNDQVCAMAFNASNQNVVKCWGNGATKATAVSGIPGNVTDISSLNDFNCALNSEGQTYCWGDNSKGQLGDGSTTSATTPQNLQALDGFGVIHLGQGANADHQCAIINSYQSDPGRIDVSGNSVTVRNEGLLPGVFNLDYPDADSLENDCPVGVSGSVALNADGVCHVNYSPVDAEGLGSGFISALSGDSTISTVFPFNIVNSGSKDLVCWGANEKSQSNPMDPGPSVMPVSPSFPSGATLGEGVKQSVVAGYGFTCVLVSDDDSTDGGHVKCWGNDRQGQLGDGSRSNIPSRLPVNVKTVSGDIFDNVTQIEAGNASACALTTDDKAYCWGLNTYGQLGTGDTSNRSNPTLVEGLAGKPASISGGAMATCAVLAKGGVQCWGNNTFGQMGNNTIATKEPYATIRPVSVSGLLGNAVQVSMGRFHACALLDDGRVQCWGYNYNGQLGLGGIPKSPYIHPVASSPVNLSGPAIKISSGQFFNCALLESGDVQCWGNNSQGQLGNGKIVMKVQSTPVTVETSSGVVLTDIVDIIAGGQAASGGYACALNDAGQVYCWGASYQGVLANGRTQGDPQPYATMISGLSDVAGFYGSNNSTVHVCATKKESE